MTNTQTHATRNVFLTTLCGIAILWLVMMLGVHKLTSKDGNNGLIDDGRFYYALAHYHAFDTPIPDDIAQRWGTESANIYPMILGSVMRVTGMDSVLACKALNLLVCLMGVWCGGLLALAVRGREPDGTYSVRSLRVARWTMIALALYPSFCCFGFALSLCRDGWIYTSFLLCSLLLLKVYTAERARAVQWMIAFFAAVIGLYFFRWYMAILMLASCLPAVAYHQWRLIRSPQLQASGFSKAFGFGCIVIMGCMLTRFGEEKNVSTPTQVIEYRNGFRDAKENVNAEANVGIYYTEHEKTAWPLLYGYSLLSNIFGPFVWQVQNTRMALAAVEGLAILSICIYLVARWRHIDNRMYPLILQAGAWLLVVGFFNDNLGTAMRLRVPSIMLLIISGVVTFGRDQRVRNRAQATTSHVVRNPFSSPLFGRRAKSARHKHGATQVLSAVNEVRGSECS